MATETNQTIFDVKVYFIIPSKYESCDECDENMWDAYSKCPDWEIDPQWITEKECLKIKPDKKDVFIMEEFKGEAFEMLQNFKCVIIGARCLLSCFLSGESIPEGTTPVFNTALRGTVITASGFTGAIKNEIQKKIEYMGGVFTKQLRASVTHLITNIVMSAKYERAVELGIKIVTIDWLKSVWETNLNDCTPGIDSIFDKYTCPVFLNLIVTSTNLNKRQKEDVKRIVNSNGGEFMGVLDGTKVKIVITLETAVISEKLKYAIQNNIPCLKIQWVYDSLEAGYSLPFSNYVIKSNQACSTPEKSSVSVPFNVSTISIIPGENQNAHVDETVSSATVMNSSAMCSTSTTDRPVEASKVSYTAVLERLNITEALKAGPFLDGCNIYLAGFSSNYRDKLNRIINVGSATRLDDISEALTHVIIGDPVKAVNDLRIIKSKALYPYILRIDWLEECMKLQAPAPEDNFLFVGKDSTPEAAPEPPSPLSKKNLQLLQRPKIPAAPLFIEGKNKSVTHADEHSEIVDQYLQKEKSEPDNSLREMLKLPINGVIGTDLNSTKNKSFTDRSYDTNKKGYSAMKTEVGNDSAIPISQESFISQKIFQGLVFIINGFKEDEYTQLVTEIHGLGGKIVGRNYSSIPDYGIVPKFGAELRYTVGEVVTDLFVEDCLDNERLVDVGYYHRPIIIPKNIKPLQNCVIGMSTYSGVERIYLSKLSEALGARYQDTFARKTNLQKNTYSSTHLICPMPQGEKYNAAVKWRLPAVTNEWIINCAAEMKFLDETPYLVGETMAPERCNVTNAQGEDNQVQKPSCGVRVPTLEAFSNSEKQLGGSYETPIINKRLNNLINNKTPQSPFHISTPETPYGQMFKDNPSPRTRKAWLRWIDHFPDIPIEEPPPKRRRSTPLSEVKRMAWDFVTGRINNEDTDKTNVKSKSRNLTNSENNEDEEKSCNNLITTNRKLSFSDDNSLNEGLKNPAINVQIAKLDEMLQKASNTMETRQSTSIDNGNPYHLEPCLPMESCSVKEYQVDSVGWEDPVKRVPPTRQSMLSEDSIPLEDKGSIANDGSIKENKSLSTKQVYKKPKFMFSGIKDKGMAEKLIKELGGEISTESAFDETATHLLCLKPARNEKILSSIAAGKWVLHYLYIKACHDKNKLINEEEFELGNPKSKGIIPEANSENEKMIMDAAYRWRIKLLNNPGGAFRNMVALLFTPTEKKEQFERLINAGGGTVVEAKPPYDNNSSGRKITHCFIQLKQIDQQIDWAMMASKGIMCFPPQFLNDHLMADNPLNPRDCVLSEFQKYLTLIPK